MKTLDLNEFVCLRCGACCCWPGDVKLREEEIDNIAVHLGMDVDVFIRDYTKLAASRRGLSLIENHDGCCIFYDFSKGCLINEVKPEQCSTFPWDWTCPGWDERCAGAIFLKRMNLTSRKPREN
jgi:Fe-S-cluster containining protein